MNDIAIECIFTKLRMFVIDPDDRYTKDEFDELTYSRWALFELLQTIMDNPLKPAEDSIEEFVLLTGWYALVSKHTRMRYIFSLANQTAKDLLDYYLESIY